MGWDKALGIGWDGMGKWGFEEMEERSWIGI